MNASRSPGGWTIDEDALLVKLVQHHGARDWTSHAVQLQSVAPDGNKNGKQCRERWHNQLRPDIKTEPFSETEQLTLIEAHRLHGNKWSQIVVDFMSHRTENQIKNYMNASMRMRDMLLRTKDDDGIRKAMAKCLNARSAPFLRYVFNVQYPPKRDAEATTKGDQGCLSDENKAWLMQLLESAVAASDNLAATSAAPAAEASPSISQDSSDANLRVRSTKRARDALQLNLDLPLASDCDISAPDNVTLDSVFGSMMPSQQGGFRQPRPGSSGMSGMAGIEEHYSCRVGRGGVAGLHTARDAADMATMAEYSSTGAAENQNRMFSSAPVDLQGTFLEMGDKRQRPLFGHDYDTLPHGGGYPGHASLEGWSHTSGPSGAGSFARHAGVDTRSLQAALLARQFASDASHSAFLGRGGGAAAAAAAPGGSSGMGFADGGSGGGDAWRPQRLSSMLNQLGPDAHLDLGVCASWGVSDMDADELMPAHESASTLHAATAMTTVHGSLDPLDHFASAPERSCLESCPSSLLLPESLLLPPGAGGDRDAARRAAWSQLALEGGRRGLQAGARDSRGSGSSMASSGAGTRRSEGGVDSGVLLGGPAGAPWFASLHTKDALLAPHHPISGSVADMWGDLRGRFGHALTGLDASATDLCAVQLQGVATGWRGAPPGEAPSASNAWQSPHLRAHGGQLDFDNMVDALQSLERASPP